METLVDGGVEGREAGVATVFLAFLSIMWCVCFLLSLREIIAIVLF